jgi:hypothetical protein
LEISLENGKIGKNDHSHHKRTHHGEADDPELVFDFRNKDGVQDSEEPIEHDACQKGESHHPQGIDEVIFEEVLFQGALKGERDGVQLDFIQPLVRGRHQGVFVAFHEPSANYTGRRLSHGRKRKFHCPQSATLLIAVHALLFSAPDSKRLESKHMSRAGMPAVIYYLFDLMCDSGRASDAKVFEFRLRRISQK